jgi:hypothetical protein
MNFDAEIALEEVLYEIRKSRRRVLHNHGKETLIEFNNLLKNHMLKIYQTK